jgi:phospholipase/carboxylesterase
MIPASTTMAVAMVWAWWAMLPGLWGVGAVPAGAVDTEPDMLETIERQTGGEGAPDIVLVWLHGLGADGRDLVDILDALNLPDDIIARHVFPNAPWRPITLNGGMVMRGWYDVTGLEFVNQEDADGIHRSAAAVAALLDREAARGIGARRVFLVGFSQGGAIALHLGLRYPRRLAGIVALSTYLPLAATFPREAHAANRDVPIFLAHGMYDPIVSPALGEMARNELSTAGYDIDWHTYPMGHTISMDEIQHLSQWFAQGLDSLAP